MNNIPHSPNGYYARVCGFADMKQPIPQTSSRPNVMHKSTRIPNGIIHYPIYIDVYLY